MTEPIFTPEDELFLMRQAAQVRAGMLEPGPNCTYFRASSGNLLVNHLWEWAPSVLDLLEYQRILSNHVDEVCGDISPYARQPAETLLRDSRRKDALAFDWS